MRNVRSIPYMCLSTYPKPYPNSIAINPYCVVKQSWKPATAEASVRNIRVFCDNA